jgi:PadR family transcriptional regulator PadR
VDDSHNKKFSKDLNSGLLSLVLLAVLNRSEEDLYGYDIVKRLHRANDGQLLFKEGSVYPVLRALSASGLLVSRVMPSQSGPPRRYYRITAQGREALASWQAIWRDTRTFVDRFVNTGTKP